VILVTKGQLVYKVLKVIKGIRVYLDSKVLEEK
jgi:hypothetical protein